MPNDLSVAGVGPTSLSHGAANVQTPPPPAPTGSLAGLPNPSLQLDPALNIVIIQLHNREGELTTSIPSQRQLEAYQSGQTPIPIPSVQSLPPVPAAAPPAASVAPIKEISEAHAAPAIAPPAIVHAPAPAASAPAVAEQSLKAEPG